MKTLILAFPLSLAATLSLAPISAQQLWVTYPGGSGPGAGKHVVLVSGDEEYRSEESLPALGKILAVRHGFRCTVLFAIDPATGQIQPNHRFNIPGLEALASADVMVIATRFRDLAEDQMGRIDAYLMRGGPVLGMRTATHAFNIPKDKPYGRYGNGFNGEPAEWQGGFGRLVLGEMWISHHGHHGQESTGGLIAPGARDHVLTRGLQDRDVWGPTDVYGVRLPLPGDSQPIVLGQVLAGMTPDAAPVEGKKNDPILPVAWTKTYQLPGGKPGRAFATTMGASTDLERAGTRRMLVNAVYWLAGLGDEIPAAGTDATLVGEYAPSKFAFHKDEHWTEKAMTPAQFALPAGDEFATLDDTIGALYACISGPIGAPRDFDRMRRLFAPDARLIPTGPRRDGSHAHSMISVDDYIARSGDQLVSMGFRETEIARRVDRFGNIAQVFSTYETWRGEETKPFMRGINSIQAVFDGKRWWILNVFWQQESAATPIPAEYLKAK